MHGHITHGIYRMSVNLFSDTLFEGIWPLPHGCSLSSYLVKGHEVALVDGVWGMGAAPSLLTAQLKELGVGVGEIRYVIMNHAEPDHTGWLKNLLKLTDRFELVATEKGIEMAKSYYGSGLTCRAVRSGDSIELGKGRKLTFLETPNVHWPETMVTFEEFSGTLFSCDLFGSFGALGTEICDDHMGREQLSLYEDEALRYFTNILARATPWVVRALDAVKGLNIDLIAPAHGPVWRRNPQRIMGLYRRFASYAEGPAEPVVTVLWGSMYGNTEETLAPLLDGLVSEGVRIIEHRVPQTHVSHILASAWRSTGIVLAMPTYEIKMFPPMADVLEALGRKGVTGKVALRVGSFGWAGGAQRELDEVMERHKMKWQFLEPVEFKGTATADTLQLVKERAAALARQVKERALTAAITG